METCNSASYRESAKMVNSLLRRKENEMFSPRTLQNIVYQEGRDFSSTMNAMVNKILQEHGFDTVTGKLIRGDLLPDQIKNPAVPAEEKAALEAMITEAVDMYNSSTDEKAEQVDYEKAVRCIKRIPDNTVVVCIDDVGVHQQKLKRKNVSEKKESECIKAVENKKPKDARIGKPRIETTVAYIKSREGEYRIAESSVLKACLSILAFLLKNKLLENRDLCFFFDGAQNLRKCVAEVFSFRPYTIHLDWFHVEKHCAEVLTMALIGGTNNRSRNADIRYKFDKRLFSGNVDKAKEYLYSLSPETIKSQKKLDEIKDYLERKQEWIYPYAVRKTLGWINSSNKGEKSNDLVVAQRCKHNGMSWTPLCLKGMCSIRLIEMNREELWYSSKAISFTPISACGQLKSA